MTEGDNGTILAVLVYENYTSQWVEDIQELSHTQKHNADTSVCGSLFL